MLKHRRWTLLLLAAGLAGLSACQHKAPAPEVQPVRAAIVEVSRPEATARYSANVLADAQVDLSFRIAGYVQSLHHIRDANGSLRELEPGDLISAGTQLAEIRPADYQARADLLKSQLMQARSAAMVAQARLDEALAARDQASMSFVRAQVLFDGRAMIKPEYDDARTQLDRAEARTTAARSQLAAQQAHIDEVTAGLREAENALRDTRLLAPFTGVIVARNIETGSLAEPGTPAFTLANIQTVKVAFGVPDIVLPFLSLSQEVPVTTASAPGTTFIGRISSISPSADRSNRAYKIEALVPNTKRLLKIGMVAAVELRSEPDEVPVPQVPLSALVHTANMDSYGVFVLQSRGGKTTARLRAVRLGQVNGRNVTVSQGLVPGEHVVQDGGLQLADGALVQEIP